MVCKKLLYMRYSSINNEFIYEKILYSIIIGVNGHTLKELDKFIKQAIKFHTIISSRGTPEHNGTQCTIKKMLF